MPLCICRQTLFGAIFCQLILFICVLGWYFLTGAAGLMHGKNGGLYSRPYIHFRANFHKPSPDFPLLFLASDKPIGTGPFLRHRTKQVLDMVLHTSCPGAGARLSFRGAEAVGEVLQQLQ